MGLSFDVNMPANFPILVRQIFSTASNETITDIQSHYDFADNPAKLAWDWTTDVIFGCNAANLASAYQDRARRYIFSAPPAVHGQDLFCELALLVWPLFWGSVTDGCATSRYVLH
jgi:hypothetical protein